MGQVAVEESFDAKSCDPFERRWFGLEGEFGGDWMAEREHAVVRQFLRVNPANSVFLFGGVDYLPVGRFC